MHLPAGGPPRSNEGGAAERLGLHFGLSSFVIGLFIVGIGTSLPELVAGLLTGLAGNSEIVCGNVLGVDIFLLATFT